MNTSTITKSDREKINKWLETKATKHPECPICQSTNFQVGDIINCKSVYIKSMDITSTQEEGKGKPMIQLFCSNCFFVFLFAAGPILVDSNKSMDD